MIIDHSIVAARMLGIEKQQRQQAHIQIEDFLLNTIDLKGLSRSDTTNIALERYLMDEGILTTEILDSISKIKNQNK